MEMESSLMSAVSGTNRGSKKMSIEHESTTIVYLHSWRWTYKRGHIVPFMNLNPHQDS